MAKLDPKAYPERQNIYAAAKVFVDECLRKDGSLFTPGRQIWSESIAVDLHSRFVQHPDPTKGVDFETKFQKQLAGAPPDTIQFAGELLYVHFLISTQLQGTTKHQIIDRVLAWSTSPVQIPATLSEPLEHGLCNAGPGFLLYRPLLLAFLVEFVIRWKRLSSAETARALEDPWSFKAFVLSVPAKSARLQQYALLHLVHPDTFEPIVSERHKQLLVEKLGIPSEQRESDPDRALLAMRARLTPEIGDRFSYYRDPLRSRWIPWTMRRFRSPPHTTALVPSGAIGLKRLSLLTELIESQARVLSARRFGLPSGRKMGVTTTGPCARYA